MTYPVPSAETSYTQQPQFPRAEGYNIRVGNRWFRTVEGPETQIQIGTRDSLAERMDQRSSIYQAVLDIGYAWGRTDLSGGEGLDWDPRELSLYEEAAALDPIRFWDSSGINTARPETQGYPYTLRLAGREVLWEGALTAAGDMSASDEYIYITDGVTVSWYNSWTDITPVGTDDLPDVVLAIAAAPNDAVVATCANGNAYIKGADQLTFVEVYNETANKALDAHGVWYVNGRFFLDVWDDISAAELREVTWDGLAWGSDVLIDSADNPFWSVVESGPAVVAACSDGTVRTYAPDASGDMTLIPQARTTMPEGESPYCLGSNAGVLLILTLSETSGDDYQVVRIYQADVLDARFNFVVGQLNLRREWKTLDEQPDVTRKMTNTRDEIWWTVKEEILPPDLDDTLYIESFWRFDVVSNGLNRLRSTAVVPNSTPGQPPLQSDQINVSSLTVFESSFGAIDKANDEIIINDPLTFQTFGYMIFPNITFGLNTPITWLATVVEAQNLSEAGAQVELWRSTDKGAILDPRHPSWVLVQRLSSDGGSNIEVPLVDLKSRTLSLQLRIAASEGATRSPSVTRIAIRGIPSHRDLIMLVPFNVSDFVTAPDRAPLYYPNSGHEIHSEVLDLVGKSVEALVLRPPMLFRGIVNNVSEPIEVIEKRGSVTRYAMVEFRGQRLTATAPATGDDGLGLGLVGVATVGIGQTEQT